MQKWQININQKKLTRCTTTTTTTNYPILHISGSILSIYEVDNFGSWNNANYEMFKTKIESELEMILETNDLIESAKVYFTDMQEPNLIHRKRSDERVMIEFIGVCTVRVSEITSIEIASISNATFNVDPELYEYFDEESISNFVVSLARPTIIQINDPSKSEISDKIGLSNFLINHIIICIETDYIQPNETELESVYTTVVEDTSKCYGSNQWTVWNSIADPAMNNGNDFELLQDHQNLFK